MSDLSSTQIIIHSGCLPGFVERAGTTTANSQVLDILLPQLSGISSSTLKVRQCLENVDYYMLQETTQLESLIGKLCSQLGLAKATSFAIKLSGSALYICGQLEQKETLAKLVNQDPWIKSAFTWLCENYSALAHSQELLDFSYAYEKNRQQALDKYKHFEQGNQGIDCYLHYCFDGGKPSLKWLVESHTMIYHLSN